MEQEETKLGGPDLSQGIALDELADGGTLLGHANGEEVLLVRLGKEVFTVSPRCTHYQGPLAEGLMVGRTVRCPWHHACFDLRTGEALQAPAIDPIFMLGPRAARWDGLGPRQASTAKTEAPE